MSTYGPTAYCGRKLHKRAMGVRRRVSREDERISRVATSCRASRYGCGRVLRSKIGAGRRTIAWSSAWHRLRMLHRRDRCGRRCTRRQDRMALLRLRLGSDRVREARPVLLVGNFDWIGSASRSLRFTARTAPRLRRRSGATRTGGAAIPAIIESDTSRPTVTSVAARPCRRCRQRRPLSRRRQLRPRSRLAQTTLAGSCDWYARRSSAP